MGGSNIRKVDTTLAYFTKLKELSLSSNKLYEVDGIEKLEKLELLHLDDNKLTDVSKLSTLKSLKTLRLWDNPLPATDRLSGNAGINLW